MTVWIVQETCCGVDENTEILHVSSNRTLAQSWLEAHCGDRRDDLKPDSEFFHLDKWEVDGP